MTVVGDFVYIADQEGCLRVVDVSSPETPTVVGSFQTSGSIWEVTAQGKYLYVTGYACGLRVLDVSDPTTPSEVGCYGGVDYAKGLAVTGDYAKTTEKQNRLDRQSLAAKLE